MHIPKLKEWTEESSSSHPVLDVLREAAELKKLNGNLLKPAPFDDLVADTFARLYELVMPELLEKMNERAEQAQSSRDRMSVDNVMNLDGASDVLSSGLLNQGGPPAPAPTKQRIKAITKRELLRKADFILSKPAEKATIGGGARPSRTEDSAKASASAQVQPQQQQHAQRRTREQATPEDVIVVSSGSRARSPQHNSAQDEAEAEDSGNANDSDTNPNEDDRRGQAKSSTPRLQNRGRGSNSRVDSPATDVPFGTEDERDVRPLRSTRGSKFNTPAREVEVVDADDGDGDGDVDDGDGDGDDGDGDGDNEDEDDDATIDDRMLMRTGGTWMAVTVMVMMMMMMGMVVVVVRGTDN